MSKRTALQFNSQGTEDVHTSPETINLLEENTEEKLSDIGLENHFFKNLTPQVKATKARIKKQEYVK